MNKNLIKYYALIIFLLFYYYNIILYQIQIGGLIYQILMLVLIISNSIILIKCKNNIKYKPLIILLYLLIWIFSKSTLQCFFAYSNILILCITGFMESNLIKLLSILISIFIYLFFLPLLFFFLINFGFSLDEDKLIKDVYEDTHYICNNDYELYTYSAGAMDSFHYSIGKYYEFIKINDILYIVYKERNEVNREEYYNYLDTNNCFLVGDKNGHN